MLFCELLRATGVSQPTFVGGTVHPHGGTTSDIEIPITSLTGGTDSEPLENDLVLVIFAIGTTSSGNLSKTVVGYTTPIDLYANSTYDTNLFVSYKFMGATPDTSVTIAGGSGSTDNGFAAVILVFRGIYQATPFDSGYQENIALTSKKANPPPITVVTPGSALIAIMAGCANGGAVTMSSADPMFSGFLTTAANTAVADISLGVGYAEHVSGTVDPPLFSFGGTDSTSFSGIGVTMAIRYA